MSKLFKPTYLYIKTHNKTGLKYFGKTVSDPLTYKGSGIRWRRHLKKHGNDVSTKILGYYTDRDECSRAAQTFSEKHNIVESKEWANIMVENGYTGGPYEFSKIDKEKVSKAVKEKQWDSEKGTARRLLHADRIRGENNHMAKTYKIIKASGETLTIKCLKSFCRENNLIWNTVKDNVGKGKITRRGVKDTSFFQSDTKRKIEGWEIIELRTGEE